PAPSVVAGSFRYRVRSGGIDGPYGLKRRGLRSAGPFRGVMRPRASACGASRGRLARSRRRPGALRARLASPDGLKRVRKCLDARLFIDEPLDACERRTLGEEVAHAGDGVRVACHLGFDCSVCPVPDPAAQAERASLLYCPGAESDALNSACNDDPCACFHVPPCWWPGMARCPFWSDGQSRPAQTFAKVGDPPCCGARQVLQNTRFAPRKLQFMFHVKQSSAGFKQG